MTKASRTNPNSKPERRQGIFTRAYEANLASGAGEFEAGLFAVPTALVIARRERGLAGSKLGRAAKELDESSAAKTVEVPKMVVRAMRRATQETQPLPRVLGPEADAAQASPAVQRPEPETIPMDRPNHPHVPTQHNPES